MKKTFAVSVEKEQLIFSAAHFITVGDQICESLHGHNYRVRCEVSADLEENSYVIDFIALRDQLLRITSRWDHRVLLPTQHAAISVEAGETEVIARFEQRRWVFPLEDCVLLPVDNTTAERLAEQIGLTLISDFLKPSASHWSRLSVGVDENEGQWAWCHFSAKS